MKPRKVLSDSRCHRKRTRARLIALLTIALLAALAACTPNESRGASYAGDFPDPSVIRVGGVYYAFGTQAAGGHPAIQRLVSTNHTSWVKPPVTDALQALPRWADDSGTWAPEVTQIGLGYVMYYSAHASGGRHCLSAAIATSPANQFVDNSTAPMLCMPNGETIDPSTVVGPYNLHYLVWKGPDAKGVATLYAQRLTSSGLGLTGPRTVLMKAHRTGWTSYNIEAPTMLFTQNRWLLFYSGGNYWSSKYAIGYATCDGPLGPCTDRSASKPWVGSHGLAQGPGGESFFTDPAGTIFMAYHAWGTKLGYDNGGVRSLWVDQVGVLNGVPLFGL
ncbi:MAG TPA: glycoside hydrolase family 43 protein [Frankiaceae bacterium]|nr:glycoside hydrolase family 43 protein [Frankiaceae bacterium]